MDCPDTCLTIIAITFLINSRHIIMGAALAPYLEHLPKRKLLPALFFMADEGWAVSYAEARRRANTRNFIPRFGLAYYFGACVPFYPVWVGFSLLGSLLAPLLGDIESYGFAMALPAMFIFLLRGMWKSARAARPWAISLVVVCLIYLLIPGPWFVLAGTCTGMAAAWFWGETA